MATKVTLQTVLKRGDIVRIRGRVLGIVVRREKFLGKSGYYAFNNSPGDRAFTKTYGADWYSHLHATDLVREKAVVITRDELQAMYDKKPDATLKVLLDMTKRYKRYQ